MWLQWGFTSRGIELIFASLNYESVDFGREDVLTVFVEEG